MKYKLINKNKCFRNGIKKEGESCTFNNNCIHPNCCEVHLCEKVVIDGFDYYVIEEEPIKNNWFLHKTNADCSIHLCIHRDGLHVIGDNNIDYFLRYCKIVIATNNPNIDIPKVVDEVEKLAENHWIYQYIMALDESTKPYIIEDFKSGYHKAKETGLNSDEDMIEFAEWVTEKYSMDITGKYTKLSTKELLQLWKEQKPEIVYYK